MSEPAVEPEPEAPLEEPEAPESPEQPETAPEPAEEPTEAPEAPRGAQTDKEIDRLYEKVGKEGTRHAARIEEIVGVDFAALAPCPLCSHFAAGFIGLVELPEAAIPTLRALLGMPDLSNLEQARDARRCPDYNGKGNVRTDSDVPGYEAKTCGGCGGIGWVGEGAPAGDGQAQPEPVSALTGPSVYNTEPEDPEAKHLRERGFTVIAPMRPVSGG